MRETVLRLPVNTLSSRESNRLLRALWAQIRSEFGKCAWQYMPRKFGASRYVRFGRVDIGVAHIEVGVSYTRKDCISELHFRWATGPALRSRLKRCVARAIASAPKPEASWAALQGVLYPAQLPFASRRRSTYALEPAENRQTRVLVHVESYDGADRESQAVQRFARLLDLLAIATNCVLMKPSDPDVEPVARTEVDACDGDESAPAERIAQSSPQGTVQVTDPDWLDGIPTANNHVMPCDEDLDAIDELLPRDEGEDLLLAAAHFRTALEIERLRIGIVHAPGGTHELSMTLYLAALEVISSPLHPPKPCQSCGQPVHAISKRVTEYVLGHEGQFVANIVKEMYRRRSKYLHAGVLFSTRSWLGAILPQLKSSDETGCLHPRRWCLFTT